MSTTTITTLEDRAYQSSQGYEMTRIVTMAINNGPGRVGVTNHRLRVIAHVGNRSEYHGVNVERWDGTQWRKVVTIHGGELSEPPTYVTWEWTREDHPGALATNEDCMEWLNEACNAGLAYAQSVLGN